MGRVKLVGVPVAERLKNFVIDDKGCHVWQGYADRNGYGRVYDPTLKHVDWVHRVSYREHVGPIPEKHELDHTCQNTLCVNPQHVEPVTRTEHVRRTFARLGKNDLHRSAALMRQQGLTYREIADVLQMNGLDTAYQAVLAAVRKGLVEADSIPRVDHLTAAQRLDIRDLHAVGVPQTVLAKLYGMDSSHISRICSSFTGTDSQSDSAHVLDAVNDSRPSVLVAVQQVFNSVPGACLSASDVIALMDNADNVLASTEHRLASISSVLSTLTRRGELERARAGLYRLASVQAESRESGAA